MFGCLPLDGPQREGGLLAGLRTYLPLRRTTLRQQLLVRAQISATLPQRHRQFCASSSLTEGTRALDLRLLENGVVEHHLLHPLQELARLPEDIAQIQSQRVHPARSAALQWAVSDVATVESVPDLATGKTRSVT